jgi:hypothetical protein
MSQLLFSAVFDYESSPGMKGQPLIFAPVDVSCPDEDPEVHTLAVVFTYYAVLFGTIEMVSDGEDTLYYCCPAYEPDSDLYACQAGYETLDEAKEAMQWIHDHNGTPPESFYQQH